MFDDGEADTAAARARCRIALTVATARDVAVQERQPGGLHRNRFDRTVQPGRVRDDRLGGGRGRSHGGVHVHLRVQKHVHSDFDAWLRPGSWPSHFKRMLLHGHVGWTRCWCGGGFLRSFLRSLTPALTLVLSCCARCVQPAGGSSPYRPLRSSVWAWQHSLVGPALTSSSVACRAQRPYLSSTSGAHYLPSSWRAPGSPSITRESFL